MIYRYAVYVKLNFVALRGDFNFISECIYFILNGRVKNRYKGSEIFPEVVVVVLRQWWYPGFGLSLTLFINPFYSIVTPAN
jgi:hypothetical protein